MRGRSIIGQTCRIIVHSQWEDSHGWDRAIIGQSCRIIVHSQWEGSHIWGRAIIGQTCRILVNSQWEDSYIQSRAIIGWNWLRVEISVLYSIQHIHKRNICESKKSNVQNVTLYVRVWLLLFFLPFNRRIITFSHVNQVGDILLVDVL